MMACISTRAAKIILITVVTIAYIILLLSCLITIVTPQVGRSIGIMPNYETSQVWFERNRNLQVTFSPAPWAFGIWAPIFTFQLLLIIYCWTTMFRRADPDGPYYMCEDPNLAPFGVLICHSISSILGAAWLFLAEWVSFEIYVYIPQTIVIIFYTISIYLGLISSYWNLHQEKEKLVKYNKRIDYGLVVGFVQNGFSIYAAWCTIATFLNLSTTLVIVGGFDDSASSISCFSVLMTIIIAYATADLYVLDIVTRYVFTPHFVVIWACSGSLARNFSLAGWSPLIIMTLLLLIIVVLALIVKIIVVVIRSKSQPMLDTKIHEEEMGQVL